MNNTVLIVDDAVFMRRILKDILTKGGYKVVGEASNGLEAVDLYKKTKPDIVTMNIIMPVMTGIEALKIIMNMDSNAKVIICSATSKKSTVMEAISNGAKDFVVKPFDANRILESLKKVLNKG